MNDIIFIIFIITCFIYLLSLKLKKEKASIIIRKLTIVVSILGLLFWMKGKFIFK